MKKHYEKQMNEGYEKPEIVENYATKRFSGRSYRHTHRREQKILESFFQHIGIVKSILDVPCGAGRFQEFLSQKGEKIVEMDYSSQMVAKAEQNLHSNLPDTKDSFEFIQSSIFDIPFEVNTFDVCFAIRIYHHFEKEEERIEILKELARVSNKWIILTFFNSRSYLQLRRNIKKKYFGKKSARYAIAIKQFKKELQIAGLALEKINFVLPFYSEQTLALIKKE